ncbi:hypothetical protein vseg_003449 [Gypsophila vaccaria]
MARKSKSSNKNKHHSITMNVSTSDIIRSEKIKLMKGPTVDEKNKYKSIHEINGIPAMTLVLDEGLVEDIEEESDPETEKKDEEIWYQRHGRKVMKIVEEDSTPLLQLTKEDVQEELIGSRLLLGLLLEPILLGRLWKAS